MFTKKSSREWLRVAASLVVFLSGTMLPGGALPARDLVPSVSAYRTPQAVPFSVGSDEWTGIDDISVFVPSHAKLDSFTAKQYAGGKVLVEWHTGLEVDNLGFNVYREVNGKRVRVTPQILAGSALMAGERTNLKSGYSYAWADSPNARDAQYWLEAIDLNGESTLFGPVSAGRVETRDGLPLERGCALLLSGVGKSTAPSNLTAPLPRAAGAPQITPAQPAA